MPLRYRPFSLDSPRRHLIVLTVCLIALVVSTPQIAAQDADTPRAIDVMDVVSLRSAGGLAFADDGSHIAYTLSVPRIPFVGDDGPAWRELHVVGKDGVDRPFVAGEVNVSNVAWLPGSKHLSFVAKRGDDEHKSLYVLPVDGGEAQRVLSLKSDIASYSWSPDGQQVAVTASRPESEQRQEMKELGFSQRLYEEDPTPVELWVAPRDGSADPRHIAIDGSLRDVMWEPQGDRLALKVSPTSLIDDGYMLTRVWIVHSESGEVLSKIENQGKLDAVAWSPDGEHLALIAGEDRNDPLAGRLMVASSGGGELRDLLPGLQGHVSQILWADTDTLRFIADEGTGTRIGEVSLSGETETLMASGSTMWGQMRQADDGSLALVGDSAEHPSEVFHWQGGESAARRLTDSNPWLAERRLAPQEVVTYAARDGLKIEGILIRPLGEIEGQRYPLIMSVHGGPESHHSNGWKTSYSGLGQLAAARGFALFYPNYRASTGRGVEFSKLDHRDPAGREFDDLVDGVDHLIASGLVDKNKVGVTGGSYGGYATAWCATYYSERFAAAVMSVGISNKISSLGNSDIPNELHDVHLREWPWENWQLFLERSPIYHVEKAKTPILITHGEDDSRVFPGQSMELYRFLKIRGEVPVRLVFYPDEGHGNRRAASRLDYMLRALRWMEHYLQGDGEGMPEGELTYPGQDDGVEEDAGEEDAGEEEAGES